MYLADDSLLPGARSPLDSSLAVISTALRHLSTLVVVVNQGIENDISFSGNGSFLLAGTLRRHHHQ